MEDSHMKVIDMEADSARTVESVVDETLRFNPDIVGLTYN
jgi:hypothetical protein